jgi:DNA-binding response OmpR family regulator
MNSRIREILLVSSVYDAYIIEEDGTLEERIWQQYADRGLSTVPRIRKVSSVEKALEAIRAEPIDLVLAIVHEEAELAFGLALQVKAIRKDLPVVVLATDPSTLTRLQGQEKPQGVD